MTDKYIYIYTHVPMDRGGLVGFLYFHTFQPFIIFWNHMHPGTPNAHSAHKQIHCNLTTASFHKPPTRYIHMISTCTPSVIKCSG